MSTSLTETRQVAETRRVMDTRIIPPWLLAKGLTRCFIYNGPSMTPTFRPGHLLYVRPATRDITPGDVIVFVDPSRNGHIVHRVVSVTDAGLVTRGDGNSRNDPLPVTPELVVGCVAMAEAKGHLKQVGGGNRGLWSARIGWGTRRVGQRLRRPFQLLYRVLWSFPVLRRVLGWLFSRQLTVVHLETPDGQLLKTTYRGRTIARWWPQQNFFQCQKPFDLIIPRPDGVK